MYNENNQTKWLATPGKSHSLTVHGMGHLAGIVCFLHHGQLTCKSQHYECDNKKKILTRMKYSIPQKYWFLPHKAVRKCSHFNKSVQTTRNILWDYHPISMLRTF